MGAGLMGAQIGCEYALGGHEVTLVARRAEGAERRLEEALQLVEARGLAPPEAIAAARTRVIAAADAPQAGWDLVVESLPEDAELKAALLRPVAGASPQAILASNTSSLSITQLGEAIAAPERTLGTHYWNPPLLMPLVEVIPGEHTRQSHLDTVHGLLRSLSKRPIAVGDVPGFAWNRLQTAILREAVWLVENGVASPDTVDDILTYGLARRWRNVGFFEAIALGGVAVWQASSTNLLPELSTRTALPDLGRWTANPDALADVAARRDIGLAADLIEDQTSGRA